MKFPTNEMSYRNMIILLLILFSASAQYEYISGNKTNKIPINYTPPYPGALEKHTMTMDSANNIYLFGGISYKGASQIKVNLLWKYDVMNEIWTLVYRPADEVANYTAPYPGRMSLHASVSDRDGNIYVHGGNGFDSVGEGFLNDLWMFNLTLSSWVFVNGNQSTNTLSDYDVPYPGGVADHAMVMENGYIYIFGGNAYMPSGYFNDMWMYDVEGQIWTHLCGNMTFNTVSNYEMPYPGGIISHSMTIQNDYIYMFGGTGYDNSNPGLLNDMWRFDISSRTWEHLSGNQSTEIINSYDTPYPGSLDGHSMTMRRDYIFIFGGKGKGATIAGNSYFNLLWLYNISSSSWEVLSGNETEQVTFDYTVPFLGGVKSASMAMDSEGDLYIFGGSGYFNGDTYATTNDLWKISLPIEYPPEPSTGISSIEEELASSYTMETVEVIIDENIEDETTIEGDVVFKTNTSSVVKIDNIELTILGTVSIYSDIVLEGDAKITTSKCIATYNNSQIIIDLATRSKEAIEVLSYNCSAIPDLNIALRGNENGCTSYKTSTKSLILIFDTSTEQCKEEEPDNALAVVLIILSIIVVCIIIAVIFVIIYGNKNLRRKVFVNRTKQKDDYQM